MSDSQKLTLDLLKRAVTDAAAIRAVTHLESAGGPGDKVFPPTYLKERGATTRYAFETRVIDGAEVPTVLLDSVASQANRMELALLEGLRQGELAFPLVEVDFSKIETLSDLDRVTSLEAPHRIADALLRDSVLGDTPFRHTDIGREFTESRPNHATGMYKHCPTALIFGCWDSTGPKGGLGSKFQRCVVSEIVAHHAVAGVKTASRIDPAGIQRVETIYESKADNSDWTTFEKDAALDKGKPRLFGRKGSEGKDKGIPSVINHGNIAPSIDRESGGVTMSHAVQTVVVSLAGLRRLRFQTRTDGARLDDKLRAPAEHAARTALAALSLAAIVYQRENDFDLRSRSLLVAKNPLVFEVLGRDGGAPTTFSLSRTEAADLLASASREAALLGLGWNPTPVSLAPAPKLARLIQISRERAAAGDTTEDGGQ
jgi:CRISPR-associated protein Csb1